MSWSTDREEGSSLGFDEAEGEEGRSSEAAVASVGAARCCSCSFSAACFGSASDVRREAARKGFSGVDGENEEEEESIAICSIITGKRRRRTAKVLELACHRDRRGNGV
ncbi:uncharacterized protein LOC122195821 [Lactuca sativa]|uniref:uncharacterized protein LOC122195821 n=1 Tax=Lactuca sativa TaxID=4236 RepID=UPI001C6901F3|nr:uncharacterized protein LOC122195821 [Lactuca sativa]